MNLKLPKLNAASAKAFLSKSLQNLAWLFFAAFVILAIFEIFELNASLQIVLKATKEPPAPPSEKGVRINFDNYDQVVKRIDDSATFRPTGGVGQNPFGVK